MGTDANGEHEGGMVSRIAKNVPFEYISIQHLGMLENGAKKLLEEEKQGFENYTFVEKDGGTEVFVELTNLPDEYLEMMNQMWPKALEVLKNLAEKS